MPKKLEKRHQRDVKGLLDKIDRLPAKEQSRIYRLIYLPANRSTSATTAE